MRVTARTYYQDYAQTVNNLHSKLNEAMEQVSTQRRYQDASENPVAYYAGKRMDNQYTDAEAKLYIIKDVKNRIYEQEQGALHIQEDMREVNTKVLNLKNATTSGNDINVMTFNQEFEERLRGIVNTMNTQYDNFFVFGGNDMNTVPFSMEMDMEHADTDDDSVDNNNISLYFHHTFPGETEAKHIKMTYKYDTELEPPDYNFSYSMVEDGIEKEDSEDEALEYILAAMREQNKVSTGYGSIRDRSTLMNTYANGLNVITGLNPEMLAAMDDDTAIERIKGHADNQTQAEDSMLNSSFALVAKMALSTENYIATYQGKTNSTVQEAMSRMNKEMGEHIERNDNAESRVSNTYRDLGIKYQALTTTTERLENMQDTLTEEYTDKLGIDTYEALVKMYSNQYAYQAAMKVGSNIMQSSLFDFVS